MSDPLKPEFLKCLFCGKDTSYVCWKDGICLYCGDKLMGMKKSELIQLVFDQQKAISGPCWGTGVYYVSSN